MKLAGVSIRNFKSIGDEPLVLDLTSPLTGEPRQITAILGDNGSGKTTVLQAIGLALFALIERPFTGEFAFTWPGFLIDRMAPAGKTTRIEVDLVTDGNPSKFKAWIDITGPSRQLGSESPRAMQMLTGRKRGGVFWFHQNRTLEWLGVDRLRKILIAAWGEHTSLLPTDQARDQGKNLISQVEEKLNSLFVGPRYRFLGPKRRPDAERRTPSVEDYYFLLERDHQVYELAEMPSGEQAIFPLIFEFVSKNISRSVVLIDELELHLHPPEQQALLSALRKLGPDCQFIITTHSPYVADSIPEEDKIRLPGGRPCL